MKFTDQIMITWCVRGQYWSAGDGGNSANYLFTLFTLFWHRHQILMVELCWLYETGFIELNANQVTFWHQSPNTMEGCCQHCNNNTFARYYSDSFSHPGQVDSIAKVGFNFAINDLTDNSAPTDLQNYSHCCSEYFASSYWNTFREL